MGTPSDRISTTTKVSEYTKELILQFLQVHRHEEKDCHPFYFMRERTTNMYRIQEENGVTKGGGPQYNNQRGFNQGNRGNFDRGQGRGGRGSIICYNCNQLGHLSHDCPNPCTTCTYCRALDHEI
jgi:hypothetical protein